MKLRISFYANELIKSFIYHYAIDTPCQSRGYIFTEGMFTMYFHTVLYKDRRVSRTYDDNKLLTSLNNETVLTFENFRATFIIETNWKASHLPKQNFIFPSYFCRGAKTKSVNFLPVGNFHIFMIDKFLLCPQITLNSTEYHIASSTHKLLIRPDGKPPVYIDYTVVNNEVRVCLVEYDAIMTSSSCMVVFPHYLAVVFGVALLLL